MLGLRQRAAGGQKFKTLQTLTVPMLCILETAMSVVKNPDNYQTNTSNHSRYKRHMRQITDFIYNR